MSLPCNQHLSGREEESRRGFTSFSTLTFTQITFFRGFLLLHNHIFLFFRSSIYHYAHIPTVLAQQIATVERKNRESNVLGPSE